MNKPLLSHLALGCALLLGSVGTDATNFSPGTAVAPRSISVSKGHNLESLRQSLNNPENDIFKKLPATAAQKAPVAKKGISVFGHKTAPKANVIAPTSALMYESFEQCEHFSDNLPGNWTTISNGSADLQAMDHWVGLSRIYAETYMFTPPAQGNMMFGIFYNDGLYKDEWLVSPTVNVPTDGYQLSFYWYTVPYYLFVIDRFHVDFDNKVFTDREILFNIEVLAKTDDSDWTKIYDLAEQFSGLEYGQLEYIDYAEMQKATVDMSQFAGKDVQIAFRYWGEGGNTFCLDAVRLDLPLPDVSFCPDYSRLFYGFTPDSELWWMDASIEFYPVNHPLHWYNTSADIENCRFNWNYCSLADDGSLAWNIDDNPEYLEISYSPDYTNQSTLANNFYFLPQLKAQGPQGGISDFVSSPSNFLQAGGSTEYLDMSGEQPVAKKYVATNFDIINEGFGIHLEEDEELGFLAEPIFGKSENTDAWWEHYCFPNGKRDDQYAYVDGFLNLYFPHESAPLVVNGVSAAALGTITDDAQFTLKIYTMDPYGVVIETPIAQQTIKGSDVIKISGFDIRDYLVLNFKLDKPVIFDAAGTGYGYLVEISGYHDDNVEYFAPLQSTVPNEYEWCLGFYHIYRSGKDDLTNEISYVAFFKDFYGRDLFTSFAIGLDAEYPWLELAGGDKAFSQVDNKISFGLRGYYDASKYTVKAPDGVKVSLKGRYTTDVVVEVPEGYSSDIVPLSFSAPGVSLDVDVPCDVSGITDIVADSDSAADLYNAQGILVKKAATADDLHNLPAGVYIHGNKKILIK